MFVKKVLLTFTLLSLSCPALAVNDNQIWGSLTAQGVLSESSPVGAYLELQTRASEEKNDVTENLVRAALVFENLNRGKFFAGSLLRTDSSGEQQEHRPWIQWSDNLAFAEWPTSLRIRHEWRSLKGNDELVQRSRFQIGVTPKQLQFRNYSGLFSTEFFYTWNSATAKTEQELSQMRTFAGVKAPLSSNHQIQLGYLHAQLISDGKTARTNHVLNLNLNLNLHFQF